MNAKAMNSTVIALAVAASVPAHNVESQEQKHHPAPGIASVHSSAEENNDGKGLGVAMSVLLIASFVFQFILPLVSSVCIFSVIVIASILTSGCCCAGEYVYPKPNVKRFATSTLVTLFLILIVQFIGIVAAGVVMSADMSNTNRAPRDERTVNNPPGHLGLFFVWLSSLLMNIMAIIFASLFTWGRWCGPSPPMDPAILRYEESTRMWTEL